MQSLSASEIDEGWQREAIFSFGFNLTAAQREWLTRSIIKETGFPMVADRLSIDATGGILHDWNLDTGNFGEPFTDEGFYRAMVRILERAIPNARLTLENRSTLEQEFPGEQRSATRNGLLRIFTWLSYSSRPRPSNAASAAPKQLDWPAQFEALAQAIRPHAKTLIEYINLQIAHERTVAGKQEEWRRSEKITVVKGTRRIFRIGENTDVVVESHVSELVHVFAAKRENDLETHRVDIHLPKEMNIYTSQSLGITITRDTHDGQILILPNEGVTFNVRAIDTPEGVVE